MSGKRSDIICNLHLSKNKGVMIRIRLRHHDGEVVTVIRDIINDIIVVKPVHLVGVSIPRSSFYIDEIESVTCLKYLNNGPLYARVQNLRESLKNIPEKLSFRMSQKTVSVE
jgi:hypothetical protein